MDHTGMYCTLYMLKIGSLNSFSVFSWLLLFVPERVHIKKKQDSYYVVWTIDVWLDMKFED